MYFSLMPHRLFPLLPLLPLLHAATRKVRGLPAGRYLSCARNQRGRSGGDYGIAGGALGMRAS